MRIPSERHEIENLPYEGAQVGKTMTCVPCLGGAFDLYLYNKDESLTGAISSTSYWESWVTAWHVQNVKAGDIYVDLGANAGYYSLLSQHLGASVYAFEANPEYIKLLDINAHYNGVPLTVINKAISDSEGTVRLNFFGDLDGSASIVGDGWDGKGIEVQTHTLDSYRLPAGDLIIKMDIEGAEELAWDGMTQTLESRKPTIILEYTPGAYSDQFWDKLTEYGKVSLLNYNSIEEITSKAFLEAQNDWVTLVVRSR